MLLLSAAGCASLRSCEGDACSADAKITNEVRAQLTSHRELGAPAAIHVQTIRGVVYLSGLVDTDLERRNAEAIVMKVSDVKDVVNDLGTRNDSR
jgi:osmotically-inducible protein OsmY